MAEVATYPGLRKPRRYSDLAAAMNGQGAFAPTPEMATPKLPANYGFGDLAGYEEQRRSNFGNLSSQAIGQYGDLVGLAGEDLRGQVMQNQGQVPGMFSAEQAGINQAGNALGAQLGSNQSALRNRIGQNQAQNQNFFSTEQAGINQAGNTLSSQLGGNQNALRNQIIQNQGQQQGVFDTATGRLGTDMTGLQGSINTVTGNKQGQIGDYVGGYGARSTDRRSALAKSLADIGSQTFSMNTPGMLEDLQRRGLASSASEVGNSSAQALKEIALRNQEQLLAYDTNAAAEEERLREMGLQTGLEGQDQLGQTNQDLFSRRQSLSQSLADRQYGNLDELSGLDRAASLEQGNVARDVFGRGLASQEALRNQQLQDVNNLSRLDEQAALEQGNVSRDVFGRNMSSNEALRNRQLQGIDELSQMDKDAFNRQADIQGSALSANLQSQQDALDSGLDLRRGGLEAQRADAQSAAERQQANELAKQERKNGITQSLIGAGGSVLGGLLGKGALSGGTGTTGGTGGTGAVAGRLGQAASIAGGAYLGQKTTGNLFGSESRNDKAVSRGNKIGSLGGSAVGTYFGGPLGAAAGGVIGGALGSTVGKATRAAAGGEAITPGNLLTAGKGAVTIENVANAPAKAVKNIVKSLCFDAHTPVTMSDGSTKVIKDIDVGDMTKGGIVESVRKSLTVDGTRYNYHGVIVSGSHAVLEGDIWKRVEDSDDAMPIHGPGIVYCLVTDKHRIYVGDITFADEHETDFYEHLTIEQSLAFLNGEVIEIAKVA